MTKTLPKLVLSASRDIPFSQLVLSQKNVRRVKAGLSIEDLAEDIYRRTLLQSINVRPLLDADGKETGMFEVPAGGRRFRALELLVKTKRMAKDQPVPCVVREAGIAEEDSLAENVMRVALHPLDQFRAFTALIEAGLSEEDIAARFFVSVSTVRQRLRLASVSPKGYDGRISAHGVAQRIAAADALAAAVGLDMAEAGWKPTVDNYLGRVTKPRIIEAVREAKGDATAALIEHLKKGDMAREAERLLSGAGWLPEPLRLPVIEADEAEIADLPDFLADDAEQADADDAFAIAAE